MLKNFKGVFIGLFFLPSPSFSYKEDLWREHKNKGHIKAIPGLLYFRSSLIPGQFFGGRGSAARRPGQSVLDDGPLWYSLPFPSREGPRPQTASWGRRCRLKATAGLVTG